MVTINHSSCQLDPKLQAELDKEDEASVRNLFEIISCATVQMQVICFETQLSLVQWFKYKSYV